MGAAFATEPVKKKWCPNPNGRPAEPLGPRFWSKVNVKSFGGDDCWEWTAGVNQDGYGVFNCKSVRSLPWQTRKKGGYELAHRMAYRLVHRCDIEKHERVLHRCDNPKCVRPNHLWLGSQQENVADAARKGRMRGPKGSANHNAIFKESDIVAIRMRLASGEKQGSIAQDYGTLQATISAIKRRKTWKHVA